MRFYGYLAVLIGSALAAQQNFNLQKAFETASNSVLVVHIINLRGEEVALGSGVVIASGEVVTNAHVALAGTGAFLTKGSKRWAVTGIFLDPKLDLALLKTEPISLPPVKLGLISLLKPGQKLFAIGNPSGLELSLSDGVVSAVRNLEGTTFIQTTTPISHGSSGGGVFNTKCELVGISTFMLKDAQNLNFAITSNYIPQLRNINIELKQLKSDKSSISKKPYISLMELQNMSNEQLLEYAKNNYASAQFQLGIRIQSGKDRIYSNWKETTPDLHKGTYWIIKAAENGSNEAAFNLAQDYLDGRAHNKNILEAKRFALLAIKNIDSNYNTDKDCQFGAKDIKFDLTRAAKILCEVYLDAGSGAQTQTNIMEALVYAEVLAELIQENLAGRKEATPEELRSLGGLGDLIKKGQERERGWIDLRDKLFNLYGNSFGIEFLETAKTRAKALLSGFGILDI